MSRVLILLFLFVATACTVPGPSEPVAQITSHQAQWREKKVRHYRISVRKINSIWHAQTNTVTVQDEQVIAQSAVCIPAPSEGRTCTVQAFDAAEFTVEGLFRTALRLAPDSARVQLRVTFDDTYAFPRSISLDDKALVDDETSWQVTEFAPLP